MGSKQTALLIAFVCLPVSAPRVCMAQWAPGGAHVLTAPGDQSLMTMVSDGAGGVLLAGYEQAPPSWTILAQKVTAGGLVADGWPASGLTVFTLTSQFTVGISGVVAAPDGAGGGVMAWGIADRVYVQRVLASGSIAPGWPASGRDVITPLEVERGPVIASDGAGGAFIAWYSSALKVKVQHVAAGGANAAGWPAAGVNLTPTWLGGYPAIAADGSGGAIVAWTDYRNVSVTGQDIYAQRLTASGAVASGWPIGGVPLCRAPGSQGTQWGNLVVIPDGNDGAIVGWWDHRDSSSFTHPYAQRVLADGSIAPGWVPDGAALSVADNSSTTSGGKLHGVGDGSGGAIFAWTDLRNLSADVYGQRLLGSGGVATGWPVDGLGLCAEPGIQAQTGYASPIISDGVGGAIVAWSDYRRTPCCSTDVYATRVTGDGSPTSGWSEGGNPLYLGRTGTPFLAPDGNGGFIAAWQETRSDLAEGVDWYALHASGWGRVTAVPDETAPTSTPGIGLVTPTPSRGAIQFAYRTTRSGRLEVRVYDIAGRLFSRQTKDHVPAGDRHGAWDGRSDTGKRANAGVYFLKITVGGQTLGTKKFVIVR